jgi:hypothetical protein
MEDQFRNVVMVLYDGVENSVFESQVIAPLLLELVNDLALEVTLISFERALPSAEVLCKKIPAHDRLHLVLARRVPFFGTVSLWPALAQLIKILKFTGATHVRARGPLAGWLVLRAVERCVPHSGCFSRLGWIFKQVQGDLMRRSPLSVILSLFQDTGFFSKKFKKQPNVARYISPVLIQARGLAAEEYRYAAQRGGNRGLRRLKDWLTQKFLHELEASVYGYRGVITRCGQFTIEAVSEPLREYLVKVFKTKTAVVTIATKDITPMVAREQIDAWRLAKRGELCIPVDAHVYVYSGSFKPWQCAQETVAEAATILHRESDAFFLILSTDVTDFEQAIQASGIDAVRCRVLRVASAELTQYLAAADVGFLLRDADVINWVSRPTKMLEYQAVGLEIVHNDTIGSLARAKH